jgi:hypothetical protein
VQLAQLLALGDAPGLELVELGQLEPVEELPPEHPHELAQALHRQKRHAAGHGRAHLDRVDVRARGLEGHLLPTGDDSPRVVVVEDAQLAQAPAQRAARIVGDVPEHPTQALAPLRALRHREIGQEGPRLLRWGQLHGLAASGHGERPEEAQGGCWRSRHHITLCACWRMRSMAVFISTAMCDTSES